MSKGQTIDATLEGERGSYTMTASCGNCRWSGFIRISSGYRAPDGWAGGRETCPACGCREVTAGSLR